VQKTVSTFCSPSGQVRNNSANDWQRRKKAGSLGGAYKLPESGCCQRGAVEGIAK
jgi:hypothetical protein